MSTAAENQGVAAAAANGAENKPEEEKLPPLSDHDFRIYNRMAERMDMFHNYFRQSWNLLWTACTNNRRPAGMSLKQFIDEGLSFARALTMHHNIEEMHIFPVLARKMVQFKAGKNTELLKQHKQIHDGLDLFEDYLNKCRAREVDFEMEVLKSKMEGWEGVLWKHLDEEVETLGAENMRKYWNKDEMMRLPM